MHASKTNHIRCIWHSIGSFLCLNNCLWMILPINFCHQDLKIRNLNKTLSGPTMNQTETLHLLHDTRTKNQMLTILSSLLYNGFWTIQTNRLVLRTTDDKKQQMRKPCGSNLTRNQKWDFKKLISVTDCK